MLRNRSISWEDAGLALALGIIIATIAVLVPRISEAMGLDHVSQGSLLVRDQDTGVYTELTHLDTDVQIAVTGPIARSRLTQRFYNASEQWVEALYAFPLPENAAVDSMRFLIGDRIIEGQIKEKQEARQTYEAAKKAGKKAGLVEQHRPNLFSSAVANIPPKGEVEIQIEYQQRLQWKDNKFSLRFPMAITPRYVPARDLPPTDVLRSQQNLQGGWQVLPGELPTRIKTPTEATGITEPTNVVRLSIMLTPGFPIGELRSLYHQIDREESDAGVEITLHNEAVSANRDFVLEWENAEKAQPTTAFFTESTEHGEFGLLMVIPPAVEPRTVSPRELTFIIDTSGSMAGQSLIEAKAALLSGLEDLTPNDAFNIVEFNSVTRKLFDRPLKASLDAIRIARRFVSSLQATGGTEILPAFMEVLDGTSGASGRLQQIVFLTDGAVGNERDIFQFIQGNLGDHRLFMVGIGSAPNSHFMVEAAHFGRGTYTHIGDTAEVRGKVEALFAKLKRPVLTGLQIKAKGLSNLVPRTVPDLYAGEPIILAMKVDEGQKKISITGRLGTTRWEQELDITHGTHQSGLRADWAREQIKQLIRSGVLGRSTEDVRKDVTSVALAHHLISPFTSLVAVDVTPSRPADAKLSSTALKSERVAGMPLTGSQDLQMAQTALGIEGRLLLGIALLMLALSLWVVSGWAAAKVRFQC
jgi:Ca-activated chloride channel homolog